MTKCHCYFVQEAKLLAILSDQNIISLTVQSDELYFMTLSLLPDQVYYSFHARHV